MEQTQEIWNRINTLIKSQGLTQSSLSDKCGFNQRRIQNLSAANRLPDAIEITLIAKALNTSVEYLVTGKNSDPYKQKYEELYAGLQSLLK